MLVTVLRILKVISLVILPSLSKSDDDTAINNEQQRNQEEDDAFQ